MQIKHSSRISLNPDDIRFYLAADFIVPNGYFDYVKSQFYALGFEQLSHDAETSAIAVDQNLHMPVWPRMLFSHYMPGHNGFYIDRDAIPVIRHGGFVFCFYIILPNQPSSIYAE